MCRVTHCDITSAFSETIVSRWRKFSGRIFQAICGESLLGPFSTAAVKDPWIGWMVWKEIIFPAKISVNICSSREFHAPWPPEKLKCGTRADSTLFYRSPLLCFHSGLSSQEVIPPHGTVLYHESVYVLWMDSSVHRCHRGAGRERILVTSLHPLHL